MKTLPLVILFLAVFFVNVGTSAGELVLTYSPISVAHDTKLKHNKHSNIISLEKGVML